MLAVLSSLLRQFHSLCFFLGQFFLEVDHVLLQIIRFVHLSFEPE